MPRAPAVVFSLVLAAMVHVDWHLARPLHHRLSLAHPYHWVITATVFGVVGCVIARFWPRHRWALGATVFVAALVIAQGIEPMLEALIYDGRFGYEGEPERWAAFWRSVLVAAPVYAATLWLCASRPRVGAWVAIWCFSFGHAIACAGVPRVVAPLRCPSGGPPSARDSVDTPPIARNVLIPPSPVRGAGSTVTVTVRLVVDTAGSVVRDSTMICGANNRQYESKVAADMAGLSFEPARRGGRPVIASIVYTFNYNRR